MISILANNFTQSIDWLQHNVMGYGLDCKVQIISDDKLFARSISDSISQSKVVIFVGDTVTNKTAFCKVTKTPLVYDKRAEMALKRYCEQSSTPIPQQYVFDKLCVSPEHFLSLTDSLTMQCSCFGDAKGVRFFFIPDVFSEIKHIFSVYIHKVLCDVGKISFIEKVKIFGLSTLNICKIFAENFDNKVLYSCCMDAGDSLLTIAFPSGVSPTFVRTTMTKVENLFKDNLYAKSDVSLEECLVARLTQMHKTVGVAESLTGGLISNKIVSVSGASKVFFEGIVSYSIESKATLLNVNPVVIDNRGVVSKEVSQQMAKGILKDDRIDFAISTTGYAGPTSEDGKPVGLCYVSVADKLSCQTYQFNFVGSRQSIRDQATNSALFLLLKKLQTIMV